MCKVIGIREKKLFLKISKNSSNFKIAYTSKLKWQKLYVFYYHVN